jgi:hypothetical protein
MSIERDRFGRLVSAITKIANPARARAISRDAAGRQAKIARGWLFEFSPQAIPARTFMTTGHQHTSISAGWRGPTSREEPDGASASVFNISEHVDVQRGGTEKKNYPITPRGPVGALAAEPARLIFWLGPPLKWGVRSARFRKPGFVAMTAVIHPGIEPHGGRDFVESASDQARPGMIREFREAGIKIAFEPLGEIA